MFITSQTDATTSGWLPQENHRQDEGIHGEGFVREAFEEEGGEGKKHKQYNTKQLNSSFQLLNNKIKHQGADDGDPQRQSGNHL